MVSQKDNASIDDLSTSLAKNEHPKNRTHLKKLFKSLIITVLAVLCIVGGVLIHKMNSFQTKTEPLKSNFSKPSLLLNSSTQKKQASKISRAQSIVQKPLPVQISSPAPVSSPISTIEEPAQPNTPVSIEKSDEVSLIDTPATVAPVSHEINSSPMIGFSLEDAILLKEHFLTESGCLADYQKLVNAQNKTEEATIVLNDLSSYCIQEKTAHHNIRKAFLHDKKKALVAFYKDKYPLWIAYLKSIPVSIIEIRKINPKTNKPKDILYKAQNALYQQDIAKAVDLVTMLPLFMQREMQNFFREAAFYNRSKANIDQLILSLKNTEE